MKDILEKALIPLLALNTAIQTYIWIKEEKYKKPFAYLYTALLVIAFLTFLAKVKDVK